MSRRRIIVVPGRTETQYVTRDVHEHRAPTDESVKLLKEFEDAADKRRIETLHLTGNRFSGTVFVEQRYYNFDMVARCVCDLNGHRITVDMDVPIQSARSEFELRTELFTKLRDKLATRLANEMLTVFASAMSAGTAATTQISAGLQPASAVGEAETPSTPSTPKLHRPSHE